MLPNQVRREVDNDLFSNSTLVSFSPPLVEIVEEDDDIIRGRPPMEKDKVIKMFENYSNNHENTVHVIDPYANEYYVNENKVDNTFFEDSYVATREDLTNIFMIPTHKRTYCTRLHRLSYSKSKQ